MVNTGGDVVVVTVGNEVSEVVWFVGFAGGEAVVDTGGDAVVVDTVGGEDPEVVWFVGFVAFIQLEEQKPQ